MDKPETLDIEAAAARWEEILDRTEGGEGFVISIDGSPKARLEPIPQIDGKAEERIDALLLDGLDSGEPLRRSGRRLHST